MSQKLECKYSGKRFNVDRDTGKPQCYAFKTLQEVLQWKPDDDYLLKIIASKSPDFSRYFPSRSKPYTLVCHDFKGGYLEDRYLQGGDTNDTYYFCRWECIDIFVYFSHHFVTVPPEGWIRAAHKHGTAILGTVITEWNDGIALWSKVLACKKICEQLISHLVTICSFYGFDGWFVNVENTIQAEQVPRLVDFLKLLTLQCHSKLPGSKVLWYDSVNHDGELKWQNELNESNSYFFDACDGIFLNYCWTPQNLDASKALALEKNRLYDVFVGVDVFGRGCFGGGGFNTREALKQARDKSLSAAIFAPGWVLETLEASQFEDNDCKFWTALLDLCPSSAVCSLPLATSFCQGHGNSYFSLGKKMSSKAWYNMSLQQQQPLLTNIYRSMAPSLQALHLVKTCLSHAYQGGCSLQLSANFTNPQQKCTYRLFKLPDKLEQTLYCSYTYQHVERLSCHCYITLTFSSPSFTRCIVLDSKHSAFGDHKVTQENFPAKDGESVKKNIEPDNEKVYISHMIDREMDLLHSSLWFHDLQDTGKNCAEEQWITRHFKVDLVHLKSELDITEQASLFVDVCLSWPKELNFPNQEYLTSSCSIPAECEQRSSILLGHLQIFQEKDLQLQAPNITNIHAERLEVVKDSVECERRNSASSDKGSNSVPSDVSENSASSVKGSNSTPIVKGSNSTPSDKRSNSTPNDKESKSHEADEKYSYLLTWDVEMDTPVSYFNIYVEEKDVMILVGQAIINAFVLTNTSAHCRITVTIQPVMSANGLPPPLSLCIKKTLLLS